MALPFPPNLLKTGVEPSVVQSCHSLSLLLGGKKENRKICISVINGPSLPPKPSQTVKPPPNCHKFYWQKSPWQECVSLNRSSYYRPPHLHCQTEFGTNLTRVVSFCHLGFCWCGRNSSCRGGRNRFLPIFWQKWQKWQKHKIWYF